MRELVFAFFIVLLFVNITVFLLLALTLFTAISVLTSLCLVSIAYWLMCDEKENAKLFMQIQELRAKLAKLKKEGQSD